MNVLKRFPVDECAKRVLDIAGPNLPSIALESLIKHEVGAVVVRNFYPIPENLVKKIEALAKTDRVSNWQISQGNGELKNSDVDTIGIPLNVAKGKGKLDQYFQEALISTRRFREEGFYSPIDKLRLELDEAYPHGCILGRDENTLKPHASGLIRLMKRNSSKGLVHMDDVNEFSKNEGVFSANIYLQTSLVGGEVEIWPVSFHSKEELLNYALEIGLCTTASGDPQAQRVLREYVLPSNPIVITPNPGDLLLLCVQRPHAVRGPLHGPRMRISAQTFILHQGDKQPLKVEV